MNNPSTLLNAVTTTGAGDWVRCDSPGAQVHVYSAAGSSCTVLIQGSQDGSVAHTLKALTDPGAAPDAPVYIGTSMKYMRCNVSARVSGTITAKIVALDTDPGPWCSLDSPANSAGALTVTSLTDSGLTATRIPFAGTAGLLEDEAAFTYNKGTNTLTADAIVTTSLTNSGLTVTRVPFAGTGGLLEDEAAFAYTKGSNSLAVENVVATVVKSGGQDLVTNIAGDGAIAVAPGTTYLSKGSAAAITLAAPTTTTHDGYIVRVIATSAQAHVITFPAGKINGGANVTATFGGAIGDSIVLEAIQGVWYTVGAPRNVTVA